MVRMTTAEMDRAIGMLEGSCTQKQVVYEFESYITLPEEPQEQEPSVQDSSLFSSEAGLSERSSDSWCENDPMPFVVSPGTASIPSGEKYTFKVTFAPVDVFQYGARLESDVKNLKPRCRNIDIVLKGTSILPICHFDMEELNVDEVREGRKICGEEEDENLKIVKFEAIGLKEANIQKFTILNPTDQTYSYKWTPSKSNEKDTEFFSCLTQRGIIGKGNQVEAVFSFAPRSLGTFEAFYNFYLKQYDLTRTFLLFGIARNPNVYFEKPYVTLKPTILGVEASDDAVLKNEDQFDFNFKFVKESLYSGGHQEAVKVVPMQGLVKAGSTEAVRVCFRPKKMGDFTFNLKCFVEKRTEPIPLSVTSSCYKVEPKVFCETDEGQKITLDCHKVNNVELKTMIPLQKKRITFTLTNVGKVGFYFSWSLTDEISHDRLKIGFKEQEGYVMTNSAVISTISITPLKSVTLKRLKVKLQIPYGPTYIVRIHGTTSNTTFNFSFDNYNFGPCLIQKEASSYYSTVLKFTNTSASPLNLEHSFEPLEYLTVKYTSGQIAPGKTEEILIYFHPVEIMEYRTQIPFFINSNLNMVSIQGQGVPLKLELANSGDKFLDFGAVTVGKKIIKKIRIINKSVVDVDTVFDIWDKLPFYSRPAKIIEDGYEIQEEVPVEKGGKPKKGDKNKDKKKSKGGKKEKGSSKSSKGSKEKKAKKKPEKKSKSDKSSKSKSSGKGGKGKKSKKEKEEEIPIEIEEPKESEEQRQYRLIRECLTVTPKSFFKVYPYHAIEFEIHFAPTEKIKTFTEKIAYEVQDNTDVLCVINASAIGAEYSLDRNFIAFGDVVFGLSGKQNVILRNTGDIKGNNTLYIIALCDGTSCIVEIFLVQLHVLKHNQTITLECQTIFKWTFDKPTPFFKVTPQEGVISAHTEVIVTVQFIPDAVETTYKKTVQCVIENYNKELNIQLVGNCLDLPSPRDTLQFECPVRTQDKKNVEIFNPTCCAWSITPSIIGQHFFAPSTAIEISPNSTNYCEVIYKPMQMSFETNHEATLFLPMADGSATTYKLVGIANDPLPVQKYNEEIESKIDFSKLLPVCNWAAEPQEFIVVTENVTSGNNVKIPYRITGNDIIEVAPNSIREYKWTIKALKEGILSFKITFMNKLTKEYLFFEMDLQVVKREVLEEIKLTTCVRRPVVYHLKLENPMKVPVVYDVSSDHRYLDFENTVELPPLSEYQLKITYSPLAIEESKTRLEARSEELGSYPYSFKLKANPPVPEAAVHFRTFLGQTVSQVVSLVNPLNSRVELNAKFESDLFWLTKPVTLSAQEKTNFEINFEPDTLGTIQSRLILRSSTVGEYIYPLIGVCMLPKPRGPFLIPAGSATSITFKNPFNEQYNFNFTVDPDVFYINITSESIKPKKKTKIVVGMKQYETTTTDGETRYPKTGKLNVKCEEESLAHIKWTYYLQESFSPNTKVSKTSLRESTKSLPQ